MPHLNTIDCQIKKHRIGDSYKPIRSLLINKETLLENFTILERNIELHNT